MAIKTFTDYPNTETPLNADNINEVITTVDSIISTGWQSLGATITFLSADAPTFVVTTDIDCTGFIGLGNRLKCTHGGVVKYFLVTAITSNSITLYGGTDYTLADTGITLPFYSNVKAPFGFPLNPDKWSVIGMDTSDRSTSSPDGGTWYNLGGIALTIPIGLWNLGYKVTAQNGNSGTPSVNRVISATLSTGNSNNSNPEFIMQSAVVGNYIRSVFEKTELKSITSKQTWYLNTMSDITSDTIYNLGAGKPTQIIAVCAYL